MKRRNQYISQLGVSRRIYGGNFVTEKKAVQNASKISIWI